MSKCLFILLSALTILSTAGFILAKAPACLFPECGSTGGGANISGPWNSNTGQVPEKKIQAGRATNPALAPQIISISPTDMDGMAYVLYQGKFVISGKNFSPDPAKNRIGIRTYTGPDPKIPPPSQEFVAEVIPLTATPEKLEARAPPIASKGKYWVWVYVEGGGQSNPLAVIFASPVGPSPSGPAQGGLSLIGSDWISNIGVLYLIQQTGNQFTWSAPSLNQSGSGIVMGYMITMNGPGWTIKAMIKDVDASGKATRIIGDGLMTFLSR